MTSPGLESRTRVAAGAGGARVVATWRPRVARIIASLAIVAGSSGPPPAWADVPGAMNAIVAGDCKAAGDAINQGLARNDPQAFFLAGYLYDRTACVDTDPAQAARFYRRAVALGDVDAAVFLGLLYGLGRGVPQDYALAHLAFSGNPSATLDASASTPEAIEAGYVETIAHMARMHVDYPTSANLKGIEAAMDVVVAIPTGEVAFERVHVGTEIGTMMPRTHDFTDQIADAYRDAMATAPKPAVAADAPRRFATHWAFTMRVDPGNKKVSKEGYITVGETKPMT